MASNSCSKVLLSPCNQAIIASDKCRYRGARLALQSVIESGLGFIQAIQAGIGQNQFEYPLALSGSSSTACCAFSSALSNCPSWL